MKSNFEFLDKEFPVLTQFGKKAEAYLYSDSNSCLMKLGMIGETIVNLMFTYDRIMPPPENTAVNRIGVLFERASSRRILWIFFMRYARRAIRRHMRTTPLLKREKCCFKWRTAYANGSCRPTVTGTIKQFLL